MSTRSGEIAISGAVLVSARVNVRQGAPSRLSPVLRKPVVGEQLDVIGITAGEEVQGNRLWFRLTEGGSYVWSGACGPLTQRELAPAVGAPFVPSAVVPYVATKFPPANVIDLYHYDSVTSLEEAKVAGVLGVIHKATTGATGRDDQYQSRRKQAKDAGLLWGAYHWGTAAPAKDQVRNFLDAAKPDDQTLVALDFEETPGNQMTLTRAREFLEQIEKELKRKAVIYSGSTIKDALAGRRDPFFGSHRLWLAQYGPTPKVQVSWDSYWLWQFTDGQATDPRSRKIPGIPGNSKGELDCNYYPNSADQLEAEWAS